jgi:hypothetical protein
VDLKEFESKLKDCCGAEKQLVIEILGYKYR